MSKLHTTTTASIKLFIIALSDRMEQARRTLVSASAAINVDDRNLAIGMLLDLERLLPECDALYRAALLFHRNNPTESTDR